jgi:anti-anti-sigma regulatory factor
MQEEKGENRRFLLKRLHSLITLADRAISSDVSLADNTANRTHLEDLRRLVKNTMYAVELRNGKRLENLMQREAAVSLQIFGRRKFGDVAIIDLRGRWTTEDGEGELLNGHLRQLVANGTRKFLLNLADVTQIDSSGVSSMVKMRIFLRSHGADVKLLHPSKHAIELLKVLHLLEMIPTFDDENLAVASFEGMATSQP